MRREGGKGKRMTTYPCDRKSMTLSITRRGGVILGGWLFTNEFFGV